MATKEEHAARREASVGKMGAQLALWSNQLDDLIAGCVAAGAGIHDAYRVRIDGLRERHGVVQTKFTAFNSPAADGGAWGTFRGEIATDWNALDAGFKDLTKDAAVLPVPGAPTLSVSGPGAAPVRH